MYLSGVLLFICWCKTGFIDFLLWLVVVSTSSLRHFLWFAPVHLFSAFVERKQWGREITSSRTLVLPEKGHLFYIRLSGVTGGSWDVDVRNDDLWRLQECQRFGSTPLRVWGIWRGRSLPRLWHGLGTPVTTTTTRHDRRSFSVTFSHKTKPQFTGNVGRWRGTDGSSYGRGSSRRLYRMSDHGSMVCRCGREVGSTTI